MQVQFFEKENRLDNDAVKGGVYLIELLKKDMEKTIPLYVGESGGMVKRCGEHLYTFFNNPEYLGLDSTDLFRSDFILKISVVESIKDKKAFWWVKNIKIRNWKL